MTNISMDSSLAPRTQRGRRFANSATKLLAALSALSGCSLLVWILWTVVHKGIGAMSWSFFTQTPAPPGVPGGGVGNAIVGTVLMTALAAVISVPLGLLGGIFLAEFGRGTPLAGAVRFCADNLVGVPSIIVGVFVYAICVQPMGNFSGYAGAIALAVIMLPIVVRTAEDMLSLVPDALRETALALGAPRWQVTCSVLMRAARTGILTGVLLAIARVSGETAPLLFTSLNSPYWMSFNSLGGFFHSFAQPTANLTVTIYTRAMSPYPKWQETAWAAAGLITVGVLLITVVTRLILRWKSS